jgi:uncharacterized protein
MNKNLILIFTRNPELGKVKTRLASTIGNKNALEIYELLLNHTNKIVKQIDVSKRVLYSEDINRNDIWDNSLYQKQEQFGQDLGARMKNAFANAFDDGYEKVVIIGTDLYDLETSDIKTAFDKLDNYDAVIGPADDGGYYLLGLKFIPDGIFINKKWGTGSVLSDTLNDIEHLNLWILKSKNDIDTFNDIKKIDAFQKYI